MRMQAAARHGVVGALHAQGFRLGEYAAEGPHDNRHQQRENSDGDQDFRQGKPLGKKAPFFRSCFNIRIFVRDQGEAEIQTADILMYVEDLKRVINADIGRKDFFEAVSMSRCRQGGRSST
jgi:hypothetical protein